jgi:hypothetical protein
MDGLHRGDDPSGRIEVHGAEGGGRIVQSALAAAAVRWSRLPGTARRQGDSQNSAVR